MEKRLKRTLMMMLMAFFPLLVLAQLADGTYYLYNVGAGLYLDHGGATNYNVCLRPHGAPFAVSNVSGETYSFKASVDKTAYLDAKATVYSTTSPVAFTVTKLSDGNYTLFDGTNFLGYNGTINSVLSQTTATFSYSADAGSKIEWRFIPKDTLVARLANATQDNPVDATFYIKEPNFNRHGANLSAWSNYKTGQNSSYL